jgi:peptide/nickel transport system permease protein
MSRYIIKRLLQLIPTIFGIYTLTFALTHILPGDPASFLLGPRDDVQTLANKRHAMGLDQPLPVQYVAFLKSAFQGDLGQSYLTLQPVTTMIAEAFPRTLYLALAAMFLAVGIGIPLGILAAIRQNSILDNIARLVSLLLVSIPVFWLGFQLQILFGVQLHWLPVSGVGLDAHLILPAVALSSNTLALLTRMARANLLEELNQDYVRTAYSKGLRERAIVWRHAFRNALLPVITVWGTSLAGLLSGALLVEVTFLWPGLGRLLQQAISSRDYSVMQGLIIYLALIYAGTNLIIDLLYPLIDPRIRFS